MKRRPAIVAYDIVCDRRRRQVLRRLKAWRLEGQYSVCECRLAPEEAEELFIQLTEQLDPREDRLMLAWVDGSRKARIMIGTGSIGFYRSGFYLG